MRTTAVFVLALVLAPAASAQRGEGNAEKGSTNHKFVAFDKRWMEPYFTSGPLQAAAERFRLDDWGGAATAFTKALLRMPHGHGEYLPARFVLAIARMNLNEWPVAGAIFEDLFATYPLLAPYHAAYAARCRLRRGDTEGALTWAARVPTGTVPEAETVLVTLEAHAGRQRFDDLLKAATSFLDRFPSGPRRAEAQFHRATALEKLGRPADAVLAYRRIWTDAPTESWSARAEERLAALTVSTAGPDGGVRAQATAADWVARGMGLFDKNQNVESEAAFTAALAAGGLNPTLSCQAHFNRAQSVFKQRQRARAAPLFMQSETACRAVGDTDSIVKSLYQGGRCVANAGDRVAAAGKYALIESEYPENSYADDARLRAAELATDDGDETKAAALLREIPKKYPKGDQAGEALWRLAFQGISSGALPEAEKWLDENLRLIPRETMWFAEGRALYWKARIYDRQKRPKDALAFYERAIKEYPLSVYALMSLERMRRAFPKERAALVTSLRAPLGAPPRWTFEARVVFGEPGFRRAVELGRLGLGADTRRELARLGVAPPDNRDSARRTTVPSREKEDIYWITAILLDRGRVWNASHAIPRYTLTDWKRAYPAGRGEGEWRLAYPRAFPEIVSTNSKQNGVSEALQVSIMREESTFNPKIESFANALGLTQMIVKTAQRFSPTKVTRDMLLDPAQNVQLGSRFLAFLQEHFSGAVPLVIAGYNAGEAGVDKWLRERGHLELDAFLESIPYDETRGYTKRVLASYFAYSWLYDPIHPVPALSFSLRPEARKEKVLGRPAQVRPAAHRP